MTLMKALNHFYTVMLLYNMYNERRNKLYLLILQPIVNKLNRVNPSIHWDILCEDRWCCLSSLLDIWPNPGQVATPTQDTSKLALILPT